MPTGRSAEVKGFRPPPDSFCESFTTVRSSSSQRTATEDQKMKWTLVRYQAKPDQADENQRLSAAVFEELQHKAPAGVAYAVFRLPDDTFVHLASLADGGTPLSNLEA